VKIFAPPILLNSGGSFNVSLDQPIDVALTLSMADLKGQFIDPEKGLVRYDAIRNSEQLERYKKLTRGLWSFDLQSLNDREKRLAFWVNIYNTAVIHGVIELGLTRSVKEVNHFFDRIVYEIGGNSFSLNEMEHGILRSNRRPPYRLFRPFGKNDPRMKFTVSPPDPRTHFALVCGARSCPPIGFYEAEQVDYQLDLAAMSFINSPQVGILPEENTLLISMIFKWYKADFGGSNQAIMDTILNYLDEGEKKNFLREHRDRIRIKYQPYDWNLNQ
jgi:hypothetical protein